MSDLSDLLVVDLVMASARLLLLVIYRISKSSLRLYDCLMAMISIIRRFSLVVLSLTIHS